MTFSWKNAKSSAAHAGQAQAQQNQAQSVQQILRTGCDMMRFQFLRAMAGGATTTTAGGLTYRRREPNYQTMRSALDDNGRHAEFLNSRIAGPSPSIVSRIERGTQRAKFVFEFGKPPDRLGLVQVNDPRRRACRQQRDSDREQNNGRCRDCSQQ